MVLFLLLMLAPFVLVVWATAAAYAREMTQRAKVMRLAAALPTIAWIAVFLAYSFLERYLSEKNTHYIIFTMAASYFAAAITTVVWAHVGRTDRGQRGFPIESTKSAASDRSDLV